jgi:hypothetical protein
LAPRFLTAVASLLALTFTGFGATGCASSKGSERRSEGEAATSETDDRAARYGDDPIGLAHRWADTPPEDAPESIREQLETWRRPKVLRVSRREDGSYRAIIARSGSPEAEALMLVIERGDGGWRVTRVEEQSATYLWPEM